MRKILTFCKKEIVLTISFVLAVASAFLVPPSMAYVNYIDWRVLGILLSLMIVMEGLKENGLFAAIGNFMLSKTNKIWQLIAVLVFLCFFLSMLITNDVALITFVPFAVYVLKQSHKEELAVFVIVLQTLAANMGSMLTPIGNPQNLYLYQLGGYSITDFILVMLPFTMAAGVLLVICMFFIPNKKEQLSHESLEKSSFSLNEKINIGLYLILFVFSILVVLRILPYYTVLALTALAVFIREKRILIQVDYALLVTFICFFVFIGNLGALPLFKNALEQIVEGREIIVAVLSSQVVSNVPAALLLSSFTSHYDALLVGINLGGLGTLIASMASLISYKIFANIYPEQKGKYFKQFTISGIIFLIILLVLVKIHGYSL